MPATGIGLGALRGEEAAMRRWVDSLRWLRVGAVEVEGWMVVAQGTNRAKCQSCAQLFVFEVELSQD
jgi:hypothetical protein